MVNRIVPLLGLFVALYGCQIPPNGDAPIQCESTAFPNGVTVTNITDARCSLDYSSPALTARG